MRAIENKLVQTGGLAAVNSLATAQAVEDGLDLRIGHRMHLTGEPAAGTSHAIIVSSPPFSGGRVMDVSTGAFGHGAVAIIALGDCLKKPVPHPGFASPV